jgi:hypothetical protein
MAIITFDTLKYVETLGKNGFTKEQSKALTNLQKITMDSAIVKWGILALITMASVGFVKFMFT